MIPILFEKDEMSFTSNGLCRLVDCISCEVTEERNSIYECDFTYPVDGANFNRIIPGRIIGVTHDDTGDIQPFDIVGYSKPINKVVTFHCVHISYRLKGYVSSAQDDNWGNSLTGVLSAISTATGNRFSISADFEATGYMSACDGIPKSLRLYLGGTEGSVLDIFGGEYEWDKFNVILHKSRGQRRDFKIRYGVNMMDYTDDVDYEDTFNVVVPYYITENGLAVDTRVGAGLSTYSGRNIAAPLDVSDKFEYVPTIHELAAYGTAYLNNNKPNLPKQNIKVEFVRLQDSPEFEQYEVLLNCKLCDTIKVEFPAYNMSGDYKIVKVVWDALGSRFLEMELGDLATSLSEALGIGQSTNSGGASAMPSLEVDHGTFSATVGASTYADITHTYQKEGYYPIGIVGYTFTGTGSTSCSLSRCFLSARSNGTCTVTLRARNASSAEATPTVDVYVLWVNASQVPNVTITQDPNTNVLIMR